MKYDTIIPIGANCRVAQALRDLNLRQEAFPLDWTLNSAQAVLALFKNDFSDYFSESVCEHKINISRKGKEKPWVLNTRYNIGFMHEKIGHKIESCLPITSVSLRYIKH